MSSGRPSQHMHTGMVRDTTAPFGPDLPSLTTKTCEVVRIQQASWTGKCRIKHLVSGCLKFPRVSVLLREVVATRHEGHMGLAMGSSTQVRHLMNSAINKSHKMSDIRAWKTPLCHYRILRGAPIACGWLVHPHSDQDRRHSAFLRRAQHGKGGIGHDTTAGSRARPYPENEHASVSLAQNRPQEPRSGDPGITTGHYRS